MSDAPVHEQTGLRTLADLVDRLHPAVLSVLSAPRGLEVPAGEPLIHDPSERSPVPRDAVVLAVGVDGERDRVQLLRRAGDDGAAAVVLKLDGALSDSVSAAAEDGGVAVLAAPAALTWGQLYTFLLTAATAHVPGDGDVAAIPLGDLFALANAVATMVGGATTIEDTQSRVLAYSNLEHPIDVPRQETIIGRQVPSAWMDRLRDAGVFKRLWQSDDVVRIDDFDEPGYLPRLAVAVRAGGEVLGSIWVIEGTKPFPKEAAQALRAAAEIAGLHLLRHRTASDINRQRRADALLDLLAGRAHGGRSQHALALPAQVGVAVVAFEIVGDLDATDAVVRAQRIADLVAVYFESYRREAACVPIGARVYALVPTAADSAQDRLTALATSVIDRASSALRVGLRAGIGSTVRGPAGAPASRREADQVLDALRRVDDRPVAHIGEVTSQVVLNELAALAQDRPELVTGRVQDMAAQDAEKGTAWVPTLRAYFDAYGDMGAAAARVNVHPNTFRYRIRRISELFGFDLADPDERLVAELQLRFLERPG